MARHYTENCLYATHAIVYCSIDAFISLRGKIAPGFAEFCAELGEIRWCCIDPSNAADLPGVNLLLGWECLSVSGV
jgi:hypothetical protein